MASGDPDPAGQIRSYRERLARADQQVRAALGDDPIAAHLLAWDAERLADLAHTLGANGREVAHLLGEAARFAERAVTEGSAPSEEQALHYLALAAITGRPVLAERVGRPVLDGRPAGDVATGLAALELLPAEEAAARIGAVRAEDRPAMRAMLAVAQREEQALRWALAERCDDHPHVEDPDESPVHAGQGGGSLDLVTAAVIALARRAGLSATTRCPWVPLDALTPPG